MLDILILIVVLGVIILIHEFGHFYFARKADILCHEFSIGMGPAVYQKRKGEIVYSIRAIPFGGYVAMAGEEMGDVVKKDQTVGLRLNENKEVTDIVLDNDLQYDVIGKIVAYDLYGQDFAQMYIQLEIDGETTKYNVLRDAKYRFKKDQPIWVTPAEKSYENKTLWQRFLVIAAGPALNFVLAFAILFVLAFFIGKPSGSSTVGVSESAGINKNDVITAVNGEAVTEWADISNIIYSSMEDTAVFTIDGKTVTVELEIIIQGIGVRNVLGNNELVVGEVFGRKKNLKENDKILKILMNNEKTAVSSDMQDVSTWNDLIKYVTGNKNMKYVHLVVERKGETNPIEIHYDNIKENVLRKLGAGYVAYGAGIGQERNFNILYPLYYPFVKMFDDVKQMFNTIVLLINPSSGIGVGDLAGPVGMFSLVKDARKTGAANFFAFVAFLSMNIGFLNLLPIPALDGGRLTFIGYELVTKKKVPKKVENTMINITFILLLILIVFVTYQDILRLF